MSAFLPGPDRGQPLAGPTRSTGMRHNAPEPRRLPYGEEVAALFAANGAQLVRLAELLTGDRGLAEELVQEAFVRTWRHWRRLRQDGTALPYVRQTVVNLARDSLRRRRLELRHRLAVRADMAGEADVGGRVDLDRALARLPLRKRACVVLRFYADLSAEETARVLGVSVGTVKSQTHKAVALLATYLAAAPARPASPAPDDGMEVNR
jgi:RNA polymerase sigma-70 factor (sigma-E family)